MAYDVARYLIMVTTVAYGSELFPSSLIYYVATLFILHQHMVSMDTAVQFRICTYHWWSIPFSALADVLKCASTT